MFNESELEDITSATLGFSYSDDYEEDESLNDFEDDEESESLNDFDDDFDETSFDDLDNEEDDVIEPYDDVEAEDGYDLTDHTMYDDVSDDIYSSSL